MFLFAETPHAYLKGVALEVWPTPITASRGPERQNTSIFLNWWRMLNLSPNRRQNCSPSRLKTVQNWTSRSRLKTLRFSLHELSSAESALAQQSAAILFCVEGEAVVSKGDERLVLKPGESAFIAASDSPVNVSGVGRLARVLQQAYSDLLNFLTFVAKLFGNLMTSPGGFNRSVSF